MPRVARYAVNNSVSYQKAQDKNWLETKKMQQVLSSHPELMKPINAGKDLSKCNFPQKCVLMGTALAVLTPTTHARKIKSENGQHAEVLASQLSTHSANHPRQVTALSTRLTDFHSQAMLSIDSGRQGVGGLHRSRYDVADSSTKSKAAQTMPRLPRATHAQPMTETSALTLLDKIGEDVQVGAFCLFDLQRGAVNATNEILRSVAEPGSVAQKIESYTANKTIKSEHPTAQYLLNDYLSYPTKLDWTYRVLGHSPGELPLHREFCLTGPEDFPISKRGQLTSAQQEIFSNFMYHAVKKAATEISANTQFTLSEAEQKTLPDVHILNKLCVGDLGSGTAELSSSDFFSVLRVPELSDANTTQDTSLERLVNITNTFRMRYAGGAIRILLEPSFGEMSDSNHAQSLARHELLHALGLPDVHGQKSITTQQTVLSYSCIQPLDGYPIDMVSCSGASQSLMPYDVFSLDQIANLVRREQAQRSGLPVVDDRLKMKSPHRGNTHY